MGGHPRPAREASRAHDEHVEDAVIELRLGHEGDAADEPAAVARDDRPGPVRPRLPAVDPEGHLEPALEHAAHPAGNVRRPADGVLEFLGGLLHDVGVEAHPGHDDERLAAGLPRARVEDDPADIDGTVLAGDGDTHRGLEGVTRHVEVEREEVAGAAREETERHRGPGEDLRDVTDRPVPPEDADEVDPGSEGRARLPRAGIVGIGLEGEGDVPLVPGERLDEFTPPGGRVVDFRRVDDDRDPLARRWWRPGLEGAGAVRRAGASSGVPAEGRAAVVAHPYGEEHPEEDECREDGDEEVVPPVRGHGRDASAPPPGSRRRGATSALTASLPA